MANVLTGLEREPARSYRGVCTALLVLPGALALVAYLAAAMLSHAPSLQASFQPRAAVFAGFLALGCIYGAAVAVLMNRVRVASPMPAHSRPGRDDVTVASVVWSGLSGVGMVTLFGALFLCGAINRLTGTVTVETGRVFDKRMSQARGCHRAVSVEIAAVPGGLQLCLSQADWDLLEDGDSLSMVSIVSALGHQAGLAPGALSQVTKRKS